MLIIDISDPQYIITVADEGLIAGTPEHMEATVFKLGTADVYRDSWNSSINSSIRFEFPAFDSNCSTVLWILATVGGSENSVLSQLLELCDTDVIYLIPTESLVNLSFNVDSNQSVKAVVRNQRPLAPVTAVDVSLSVEFANRDDHSTEIKLTGEDLLEGSWSLGPKENGRFLTWLRDQSDSLLVCYSVTKFNGTPVKTREKCDEVNRSEVVSDTLPSIHSSN